MSIRINSLLMYIAFCAITCTGPTSALAQNSVSEFQNILREKAAFNENDFDALVQGQSVVRSLPVTDKREVAVCGLVKLQVPAEVFLQSFRDSMTRKVNPAILEIGRFNVRPTPADLQELTFEDRDLEDLKQCVVGDCKLKLSAKMIERIHKQINWAADDYRIQATQLLKQILSDYVSDYVARGDLALIEYFDKAKEVRLTEEQQALMTDSTYIYNFLPDLTQQLNSSGKSKMSMVESAIVWSKIKFGLKPIIAINHIMVYKREENSGPQVLVASKQIYANHYFDSSLALTAFVSVPGAVPSSYLVYENRSRADGLGGLFGKMKRGIVENRAVESLQTILQNSKAALNAHASNRAESASATDRGKKWKGWKVRRVHVFFGLMLMTALVALFTVRSYNWKSSITGGTVH